MAELERFNLALLADIDNRKVCDDEDFAPRVELDDGTTANVSTAVWELEREGLVTQPTGTRVWELTAAGRLVLDATVIDEGEGLLS